MMKKNDEKTQPLPGLLPTLAAGFELVTAHWWLLLLPVLLDAFLWLGPRLSSRPLILEMATLFQEQEALAQMGELLASLAGETNLFTSLSVPVLGVPVLMASFVTPPLTPVEMGVIELSDPVTWTLAFAGLSLVGLLLAAVYYGLVAAAVRAGAPGRISLGRFLEWMPIYGLRVLLLVGVYLLAALAIQLPLLFVGAVATLLSPFLASFVFVAGFGILLWLLFYLSFSLHGILLNDRPIFLALMESLRLVRAHAGPALTLLLAIFVIRNLLSSFWLWVDAGNWLTLVSIVGHAFVTTALAAATFVFYRDRVQLIDRTVMKGGNNSDG